MGPFAPLGDSIFGSLVPAIMGSIAATLAVAGNPAGIFLWIAVAVAYDIFRWKQLEFAYKEGVNLINNMQSTLTALIDAAAVLGIFMVGALIASMIGVEVSWTPHIGDKAIEIQDMLNLIFPRLVPAIITGVIYWLLGRKGMNSTKLSCSSSLQQSHSQHLATSSLEWHNGVRYGKTPSIGQSWSLL